MNFKQLVNEDNYIVCPECGETMTHLCAYAPYYIEDRLCLNLMFDCEQGHIFSISINQHEGITMLKTNPSDRLFSQSNKHHN